MQSNTPPSNLITRREAIQRVSALFGGAMLVGQTALISGCASTGRPGPAFSALFSAADVEFLDEVADTILPETGTPGAKAAGVGPFMALMVADTYEPGEQQIFHAGLGALDQACLDTHGDTFMAASQAERLGLLERIDREQYDYMRSRARGAPTHYFRMMKELALLGYFTSEIGYKEAMRYVETPGRFEPCVPYLPGDRIWASHA